MLDCKYKPRYLNNDPSLEDKRQLPGYVRLRNVYNKLDLSHDKLIKGLIKYSHHDFTDEIDKEQLFKTEISEYVEFYKLGVGLPVL